MMNFLYKLCCFAGIHFPLPITCFIGRRLAEAKYIFRPDLRNGITKNLKIALKYRAKIEGKDFSYDELRKMVKQSYYNFVKYLVDFFNIPKWTGNTVRKKVKVENIHCLDKTLSSGKGVIVLTAHLGNWELAGVIASLLGYKINAIALPFETPKITKIIAGIRESKGVKVIFAGANLKSVFKAMRKNEILAVLGDRVFTEKGVKIRFMGKLTLLPRGPATIAVKTGARMVAGFLVTEGDGYKLFFENIQGPPESMSEEEKILFLVRKGAEIIEKNILLYPNQWLNFSPMWKE